MINEPDERKRGELQVDLNQEQALADLDQSVADHDQAVADRDQDAIDQDQEQLEVEHPIDAGSGPVQFELLLDGQRALDIRQARADARQDQISGSRPGGEQRQALIDDQQRALDEHDNDGASDVQEFQVDQAARRKAAVQRAANARERALAALERAEGAEQRARAIVDRDAARST